MMISRLRVGTDLLPTFVDYEARKVRDGWLLKLGEGAVSGLFHLSKVDLNCVKTQLSAVEGEWTLDYFMLKPTADDKQRAIELLLEKAKQLKNAYSGVTA